MTNDEAIGVLQQMLSQSDQWAWCNIKGEYLHCRDPEALRVAIEVLRGKTCTAHDAIIKDYGSVEGTVEFAVYDDVTDRHIPCVVPQPLLPEILEAAGKRACVSGVLRYNHDGQVEAVSVEDVRVFPSEESLPSFDDICGILGGAE